jgi:DnaJ family protein C protein 19
MIKMGTVGKLYKGGFDAKMSKREAALILAIRESSTKKEIREAHRRLMMLNHPDSGGSTYLASKVNEAKEFLMVTASDEKI